ncbi:MAG: glycosyltransferase, partial [Gemmatimonadetes bacterium]|nr:glycosyltransferase [Gemmatimonadota bacterium]
MRLTYLCLQATREGQAAHAHVHEIIAGLRRLGWQVQLFEPHHRRGENTPLWRRAIEFMRVQAGLWLRGRPGAGILYIRNHHGAFPTALLAKLLRIPVVQEVNGPYEDLFVSWPVTRRMAALFRWLFRVQLRWANAVVAVTPQLADWVRAEAGEKRVVVVPNGANTDLFHPGARTERDLPARFVVFFGALAPWQGVDTLLEAVESAAWPADVALVIAGDGGAREKVQAAAARNPLVRYLGALPYREVPGVVARSLASLCPKNNIAGHATTGLNPLKLFETAACGVPIVVTDFPGQADVVRTHGCGVVIPPENGEALARAVARLAADPEESAAMG